MSKLPVARLIKVSVLLAPQAARSQNLSSLLVLTDSTVIDPVERMRTYTQATDVAADFGSTGPEYQVALNWFSQRPQPKDLKIGRWVKEDSPSQLICGPLATSDQDIEIWNLVNNGGFQVVINGSNHELTELDFSLATNFNAVATEIQEALEALAGTGFKVSWNADYKRFTFTNGTVGEESTVGFLTSPVSGQDISEMLKGQSDSDGAYTIDGANAESAVDAVLEFDDRFGQQWYCLKMPQASDDEHLEVAATVEATVNKHFYVITTQSNASWIATSTTDVGARIAAAKYTKTAVQYSSTDPYAGASMMARILTTNYNANNSVITLMYKQEPGIVAEELSETQMRALAAKHINVFVAYNNETAIIEAGTVGSGDFIDLIVGIDAMSTQIMTEVYNLLYTSNTKIPQTDPGTNQIISVIKAVLVIFVRNGFLAPGTWTQEGFGQLSQGDYLDEGFYIYAPPVSTQLQSDREARVSVPIQIAAKCAGAVHTVDIILSISR